MDVEVGEENNERNGVTNQAVMHPLGKVAVDVQRMGGMDDGQRKLQLEMKMKYL